MTATVWGDGTPNEAYEIPPASIINEQAGNYLILEADAQKVIDYVGTGGDTITLPASADAGEGFAVWVRNSGTGAATVATQGSDTVNSGATLALNAGTSAQLILKGIDFGIYASNGLQTQAASAVTVVPAGRIAATDVQAALEELDVEKAELWEADTLLTDTSPSANVITATAGRTLTAQAATGSLWRLERSSYANTGACTLNIDGQGAVVVVDIDGNALISGSIPIGRVCIFYKAATSFVLLNPANSVYASGGKNVSIATDTNLQTWADTRPAVGFYDMNATVAQNGLPIGHWYITLKRYSNDAGATVYHALEATDLTGANPNGTIYHNTNAGGSWSGWAIPVNSGTSGSFTITATGLVTPATGTAYWWLNNGIATLRIPSLTGTSNSTDLTLTGLPAAIQPSSGFTLLGVPAQDASTQCNALLATSAGTGTLTAYKSITGGTWTNSATTKGINPTAITYPIG